LIETLKYSSLNSWRENFFWTLCDIMAKWRKENWDPNFCSCLDYIISVRQGKYELVFPNCIKKLKIKRQAYFINRFYLGNGGNIITPPKNYKRPFCINLGIERRPSFVFWSLQMSSETFSKGKENFWRVFPAIFEFWEEGNSSRFKELEQDKKEGLSSLRIFFFSKNWFRRKVVYS